MWSRWCARCSPAGAAFHDGEDQIVPGVTVHHIGGHSKGLQSVRVKTRLGHVVLAADASHLYAHIDGGRVFPLVYNVGEVVEGYETLKKLAAAPRHLVPGHDPLVLARYPAAKPGLEGWIVRLDAEPKRASHRYCRAAQLRSPACELRDCRFRRTRRCNRIHIQRRRGLDHKIGDLFRL